MILRFQADSKTQFRPKDEKTSYQEQTYFLKMTRASNKIEYRIARPGNTVGGSINVPFTSCLTCLDLSVLQIKTKIVSCHMADSKPVKQEVNCTVMLPPFSIPWLD
jgi:hypothetical protein